MECYDIQDGEQLSQPQWTTAARVLEMPVEIQQVQTKGKSAYHSEDNACNRNREDAHNQTKEKFCKSCITHRHTDKECTKMGAAIPIAQYLQTCSAEKKQQILEAYREKRKAAHARYLVAYERRKDLKKKICWIQYKCLLDPQNGNDPQAKQTFKRLRVACIWMAQADHPDMDFGSIDDNYSDLEELMIDFNPAVDELPPSHDGP